MRRKLDMEKVQNPIYWKQVKSKLEAANTKEASIAFRKKLLDDQKRMNYSSEHERINGILNHSSLPSRTIEGLTNRRDDSKAFGAKAFQID